MSTSGRWRRTVSVVAIGGGDAYEGENLVAAEFGYRAQPLRDRGDRRHAVQSQLQRSAQPGAARDRAADRGRQHAQRPQRRAWSCRAACSRCRCGACGPATPSSTSRSRRTSAAATSAAARPKPTIPSHMFGLRTDVDLPRRVELSLFLRSIGELPNPRVPRVHGVERPPRMARDTSISKCRSPAQDLLHDHHPEFGARRAAARRVRAQRPRAGGVQVLMRRFLVALLLCAARRRTSAQDVALEYRVKAAYLFNFTKFVEWPSTAPDSGHSFSICAGGTESVRPDAVVDARG